MTLLDPDAGEILDRLSILARKRLEKPERAYFTVEEAALAEHYGNNHPAIFIQHLPALLRLAAVNGALWQAEDDTRRLRGIFPTTHDVTQPLADLADCAKRLQTLNEERSRLIQFFNAELGRGAVEEKDFKL